MMYRDALIVSREEANETIKEAESFVHIGTEKKQQRIN